jgi:hypothetical protein
MNKYMVLTFSLLFFCSTSQAMLKHKKSTEHNSEQDTKTKITNLDDGIKKLREDQLQYRSKHKAFKDEPNDVRLNTGEKK